MLKIRRSRNIGKLLKKMLLSAVILLLIAILGGATYVYIVDREAAQKLPEPVAVPAEKPLLPEPSMPGPNAPNSAAVQYIETPVKAGDNSTITVTTGPNAACTIAVAYNNIASKDSGLMPKAADVHGSVTWSWTVDKTAAAGKWPVKVTCVRNNKTGYVEGYLEVTK
ncbi:hypothetical protein BH10PAT3_BH10PAT3_4340 [soil metagenome]